MDPLTPCLEVGGYREYRPPADLAPFCEAVWVHQTPRSAATDGTTHRVLPEVAVCLAFQVFRDGQGRPLSGLPIIVGPRLRAQPFDLVPGRELAAIRIKSEWVGPLLGIDPLAIENQVTDLANVSPHLANQIAEPLYQTRAAGEALDVLIAAMRAARERSRTAPSAAASAALELVRRSAGRVACGDIASTVGCSDRHLRRQIIDAAGVAPKAFARVLRFVTSMLAADGADMPAWADIAAHAGYCDQSHLNRDCTALAGASPGVLHAERRRETAAIG